MLAIPRNAKTSRKTVGSYPVTIELAKDGYFVAECPVFDGCYSQGKTEAEALDNIKEAILLCLEERLSDTPAKADFRTVTV